MAYSIPNWNAIDFTFGTTYYLPNALSIQFELSSESDAGPQYILCTGFDAASVNGTATVSWRQYVLPNAVDALAFGEHVAYTRFFAEFGFNLAYSPPAWNAVGIDFAGAGSLFSSGINDGAFGTADVANSSRDVLPSGIAATSYGSPSITLGSAIVAPSGFAALSWGTARVVGPQYIIPSGLAAFKGFGFGADGSGFVSHLRRTLVPSGISALSVGAPTFTNQHRTIDLAGRSITGAVGAPMVADGERRIYPSFIYGGTLGTPVVDQTHYVVPSGIDELAFGVAWVHDNKQYLYPSAFAAAAYGEPELTRSPRLIEPVGFPSTADSWPSTRWGIQTVYNSRQYVTQFFAVTPSDGGAFGDPIQMLVENRNRTIQTYGHKDSVMSGLAHVDNAAVPLLPAGLDATLWGGHLVAYRIRNVYPDTFDSTVVSIHNEVYNDAALLAPPGFGGEVFGTAWPVNTRRYYDFYGWDSQAFGQPFVAPRVRTLTVGMGPESGFGYHGVQWGTNYIAPSSIDVGGFGGPDLFEHFNIIYPTGPNVSRFGDNHRVYNLTPEVAPWGVDQTLWGVTRVYLQYRYVEPSGVDQTLWGRHVVADRRLWVAPSGPSTLRMSTHHEVRNLIADPPAQQVIATTGFWGTLWGTPSVSRNELYPEGYNAIRWGQAVVTMMGCYPAGIGPLTGYFPSPWVKGPQYVAPRDIEPVDASPTATKHALSPHTIWCTFDATAQAVANNGGRWELMDYMVHNQRTERPVFGSAAVTLGRRSITLTAFEAGGVGQPAVELKHRRIYPTGLRSQRFGTPSIPYPRTITKAGGVDVSAIGRPSLENQHRALLLDGIEVPEFSEDHRVELFNRTLFATGFDAFSSTGHRVHPPEPLVPHGYEATQWGDAFISNWVRTLFPEGFETFACDSYPGEFKDRMRVRRAGVAINPRGIVPGRMGTPSLAATEHVPVPPLIDLITEA